LQTFMRNVIFRFGRCMSKFGVHVSARGLASLESPMTSRSLK
jgi:hypothetical protein